MNAMKLGSSNKAAKQCAYLKNYVRNVTNCEDKNFPDVPDQVYKFVCKFKSIAKNKQNFISFC